MTSKLTREWLQHQISAIEAVGITDSNTLLAFKLALSAMGSEPVDEVYAELYRLREEVKGPDGFNTWRDAAIAEKKARVELERQINQSGRDIDYLGAMAAFHSNEWHKMDPITGYMHGWNARRNHAQPAPVVPEDIPDSVYEILCQACGGKAWMYEEALWNACRAAMLQAQSVCTCPSGDGSLRWPCPSHPGNSPAIPDGLIAAVNRLLDSDGSRGCYSAISCYDAHKEIEHLLAAAPPAPKQENI
ncbi:TPA: hypothetical protein ACK1Z8_005904 [Klebsiella michiganensis]